MGRAKPRPSFPPTGPSPAEAADRYWAEMDARRTAARSLARAELALGLLRAASISGGRLLDVGCGPGWALERFRQAGFEVAGVEASPAAAAAARSRGLPVEVRDVEAEPLPAGFLLVAAFEVLEHLRDPLRALLAMERALETGGRLLVSLPNELHLLRRLAILLGRPQAAGHRRFGGHDDPHLRHFTPRTAERLFASAGLAVQGRAWDGLVPPRLPALRSGSQALARLRPALFACAGIYLLRPADAP